MARASHLDRTTAKIDSQTSRFRKFRLSLDRTCTESKKVSRYPKKQTGRLNKRYEKQLRGLGFQVRIIPSSEKSPNPHSKVFMSHPSGDTGWKNSSLWPDNLTADLGRNEIFLVIRLQIFHHFHDRSMLHLQDKS